MDTSDAPVISGDNSAPDISAITGATAPPPAPIQQAAPAPPAPQGQPSVWKNLVAGALFGLAGSAGSNHFGSGLAGGAEGAIKEKQRGFENAQAQTRLNFESVQAADSHIRALDEHRRADQLSDEAKLDYKQKSAGYQAFLQDNFGIEPNLSFNDSHADSTAALSTGANMNGGTIPPVVTVQQPAPDGQHGQIAAYSPTQQQMQQNSNGWRQLVNQGRAIQGLPDIDNASWNSLGFKGQRDQAQQAISALKPTPTYSLDKTKPDYLPVVLAQKQQQLQQYENHKDINGKSDADPSVVRQLQAGVDYLQSSWDKAGNMEADQAKQVAKASEQGRLQAQESSPVIQSRMKEEAAQTEKATLETSQIKKEIDQQGQPDATGFTTNLPQKEYDKRFDSFARSKQYTTLQTLQGSYDQFQDTVNHISQTGNMTGAESVVGLFNAIGISATPLTGKGFRINDNTVREHENARGLGQAAYQKLLSLKAGDVITPQQLKDYSNIAADVYTHAYVNAADEAHRQGLPADFLPKGGGKPADQVTANIFAQTVAHTHPELAQDRAKLRAATAQALTSYGWGVQ